MTPQDDKDSFPANPLRDIPLPDRLYVPCNSDAFPFGATVRRGEPLAHDPARCPAPAGGRVVTAAKRQLVGGSIRQTVELETVGDDPPDFEPAFDAAKVATVLARLGRADAAHQIARMLAAGVCADRWSSPDLAAQLEQVSGRPMDCVICGALDLDPALPLQRTLAAACALEIAAGTAALAALAAAPRAILAVPEDMAPAGVAALRQAAEATGVRLFPLPNEYPMAHASLLIRRIIHRRLALRRLPTEVGALMLDAPAAIAAGRWFVHGRSMLRVSLGVYDSLHATPHFLSVPVGTRMGDVLAAIGFSDASAELHAGHLLRDVSVSAETVVAAGELTVFASRLHAAPNVSACLRCGWCVDACPVRIHPAGLLDAAQFNDLPLAERNGLKSCIECGICGYVCPSRLPLLPAIRTLRAEK